MRAWRELTAQERRMAVELMRIAKSNYEALHPVARTPAGLAVAKADDELMTAALGELEQALGAR